MGRNLAFTVVFLLLCAPGAEASTLGCVLSDDGSPVAGAEVRVLRAEPFEMMFRHVVAGAQRPVLEGTTSGEDGVFVLDHLVGAGYEVIVTAKGFPAARADRFGVRSVVLTPAPMVPGRVTSQGEPVAGATVFWVGGFFQRRWVAVTDQEGRYQAPDPSLWARFAFVWVPGGGQIVHVPWMGEFAEQDVFPFDIEIEPALMVAGRVVDQHGNAVEGAEISDSLLRVGRTGEGGTFSVSISPNETIAAEYEDQICVVSSGASPVEMILEPGCTLTGRVVDERGNGVPFADVSGFSWRGPGPSFSRQVAAASDGSYELTPMPAGTYYVSAFSPGFFFERFSVEVDLSSSMAVDLDLVVERRVAREGWVVDGDGRPIAGAAVFPLVQATSVVLGVPFRENAKTGITFSDSRGRFEILMPEGIGLHRLMAIRRGSPPGVSGWLKSADSGGQVTMILPTAFSLKGRVLGPDGKPLKGVDVGVVATGGIGDVLTTSPYRRPISRVDWFYSTSSDGSYDVPVAEGDYDLVFDRRGYLLETIKGVSAGSVDKPLTVTLRRPNTLSGQVLRWDGLPVVGAEVTIRGDDKAERKETTGPDGMFRVTFLDKGPYKVHVSHSESGAELFLESMVPGPELNLVLPETFSVRGQVIDGDTGEPLLGAELWSDAVGRHDRNGGSVTSGKDGLFEVKGLVAGHYEIQASAPTYLKRTSREVEVGRHVPREELVLALVPGLNLGGRVVDGDGNAVPGAEIQVRPGGRFRFTDENGQFFSSGLAAGEVTVLASKEDLVPVKLTIQLDHNLEELELELVSGHELGGRVEDNLGTAIAGALVSADFAVSHERAVTAISNADGIFHLSGLATGEWRLRADAEGFDAAEIIGVDPERQSGVTLVLSRVTIGTVVGTISNGAKPVSGEVSVFLSFQNVGHCSIDGVGQYRIDNVPARPVRVAASIEGSGWSHVLEKEVEVQPRSVVTVDFDFAEGATVSGRVTRRGEPEGRVTIITRDRGLTMEAETTADDDGFFQVAVPEGDCVIFARAFDGLSQRRALSVGGATFVDIELVGPSLAGRLRDATSGEPIAGAAVNIDVMPPMSWGPTHLRSDSNGGFLFDVGLAPGSLVLLVEHPDYCQVRLQVELQERAQRQDVEIVLLRSGDCP